LFSLPKRHNRSGYSHRGKEFPVRDLLIFPALLAGGFETMRQFAIEYNNRLSAADRPGAKTA